MGKDLGYLTLLPLFTKMLYQVSLFVTGLVEQHKSDLVCLLD